MLSTLYQMAKFSTMAESFAWSVAYESYGPVAFADRAHAREIPRVSRTLINCFKLIFVKKFSKVETYLIISKFYSPSFYPDKYTFDYTFGYIFMNLAQFYPTEVFRWHFEPHKGFEVLKRFLSGCGTMNQKSAIFARP